MDSLSASTPRTSCVPSWLIRTLFCLGLGLLGPGVGSASAGLHIVPTFDSSITNSPNAAAIKAGINAAITQLERAIKTPITVRIKFYDVNYGLGTSQGLTNGTTYSAYLAERATHETRSVYDVGALGTLPGGPNNPVNGTPGVTLRTPLLRAIGDAAGNVGEAFDGEIFLFTAICNLVRTGPQDPDKYDLEQVTLHEIVEILGAGGGGSVLPNLGADAGAQDLFRYGAPGVRSFTTSPSALAYFSIDAGTTNLGYYLQSGGGDYGDWDVDLNGFPQVQDAASTPGVHLDLDLTELIAIDVVGYDVDPTVLGLAFAARLADYVGGLSMQHGVQNSLLAKLRSAQAALAGGNGASACGSLQALINESSAQRGKKLTVAEANQIIDQTRMLRSVIGCS